MNPLFPKEEEQKEVEEAPKPEFQFTIDKRAFKNWDRDNEDRAKAKLLKEKLVGKWWAKRDTLGWDFVRDEFAFSKPMILLVGILILLFAYGTINNFLRIFGL